MDKKWIWILVALVVVIGTLIGLQKAGITGQEEGTKVSVEKFTRRNIPQVVNASGTGYR